MAVIECLVIGQANVGKTLLSLRLAEEAGNIAPLIVHELPEGEKREWKFSRLNEAISALVDARANTTTGIQTLGLGLGIRMSSRVLLHDSTGLSSGYIEDRLIRLGMAKTLGQLNRSELVLHVVDGEQLVALGGLPTVDEWITRCMVARGVPSALIVNKVDLRGVKRAAKSFAKTRQGARILVTSALSGEGIGAVLHFLRRA